MKRIVPLIIISSLMLGLPGTSYSAVIEKTVVKTKVEVKTQVKVDSPKPVTVVKPVAVVVTPKPLEPWQKSGWFIVGGYGGGAGLVGAGYNLPITERLALSLDGAYGFGNGYSVIKGGVSGLWSFGRMCVGGGVVTTNYSETVTEIPGLSGNYDKGTWYGGEVFVGYTFGAIRLKAGYNTGLAGGLTAVINYKW